MLAADAEDHHHRPVRRRRSAAVRRRTVALEVPRRAARSVAPSPGPRRRAERGERWVLPFAITLAGSLGFFLWQMAEYTNLLAWGFPLSWPGGLAAPA